MLFPLKASRTSACALAIAAGYRIRSVMHQFQVVDEVSLPAPNKSCKEILLSHTQCFSSLVIIDRNKITYKHERDNGVVGEGCGQGRLSLDPEQDAEEALVRRRVAVV